MSSHGVQGVDRQKQRRQALSVVSVEHGQGREVVVVVGRSIRRSVLVGVLGEIVQRLGKKRAAVTAVALVDFFQAASADAQLVWLVIGLGFNRCSGGA